MNMGDGICWQGRRIAGDGFLSSVISLSLSQTYGIWIGIEVKLMRERLDSFTIITGLQCMPRWFRVAARSILFSLTLSCIETHKDYSKKTVAGVYLHT